MNHPKPTQVAEARNKAGLSQSEAAKLVYSSRPSWARWEAVGDNHVPMPRAEWELFLIKTGQLSLFAHPQT